jgi:hypothetical protein
MLGLAPDHRSEANDGVNLSGAGEAQCRLRNLERAGDPNQLSSALSDLELL